VLYLFLCRFIIREEIGGSLACHVMIPPGASYLNNK
jgi:hypothetical protein